MVAENIIIVKEKFSKYIPIKTEERRNTIEIISIIIAILCLKNRLGRNDKVFDVTNINSQGSKKTKYSPASIHSFPKRKAKTIFEINAKATNKGRKKNKHILTKSKHSFFIDNSEL